MSREEVRDNLNVGETAFALWRFAARFIAPLGVVAVFIVSL
jgi:NSS family neurotransmitter:Na+ symporter